MRDGRWPGALLLGLGLLASGPGVAGEDETPGTGLLREALSRRYDCDLAARLRLRSQGRRGGARERELETVTRQIRGRTHSLARIVAPERLRGMTMLAIEGRGRADDVFVHLPSLGRTRRMAEARPSESFLGTDLAWADLDRHRLEDYVLVASRRTVLGGREAQRLETRPRDPGAFARVDFVVGEGSVALLGIDYWESGEVLRRSVRMDPSGFLEHGACRIPTRLEAIDHRRGTRTTLEVEGLEFDPAVPDGLFTRATLDSGRPITTRRPPDAAGRMRAPPTDEAGRVH